MLVATADLSGRTKDCSTWPSRISRPDELNCSCLSHQSSICVYKTVQFAEQDIFSLEKISGSISMDPAIQQWQVSLGLEGTLISEKL